MLRLQARVIGKGFFRLRSASASNDFGQQFFGGDGEIPGAAELGWLMDLTEGGSGNLRKGPISGVSADPPRTR